MVSPVTITKIFSTLGNNSSLVPLGIKDVSNIAGMTTGSYITGDHVEGKDRFIDELGTSVIWLMGIPFFKKVIDKTVYKLAKINPNIDTRILNDKEIFESAKKHANSEEIKASFEKIAKNKNLFKGLAIGKFIAATALTLASYSALTNFRHKHTEKSIIAELKKEEEVKKAKLEFAGNKTSITSFGKKQQKPSFGMNWAPLQKFMFDPVKNTMIIDGGITTERLSESRNPQDFMGYVIKEGGFLGFMYVAGPQIQKYLEKKAAKNNKPIDLDIRVLQNKHFQDAIKDKSIEKHLKEFSIEGKDVEIYDALFEKSDNLIVKMAKESGLVTTIKNTDKIDSQSFIDIKEIKAIKTKIQNLYNESLKSTSNDFFKDIVKLKRMSIVKNIGFSIAALGLLVPGTMVAMRLLHKDNKEFQVKKDIKEKLMAQNFQGVV